MTATINVIRLVGGPPKLDGSLCDLRLSARDRADADGDRFVRAVHGSTVTALAGLQPRCTDRVRTTELASVWRAAVYRPARPRARLGWRPTVYRFEGHYSLEPRRDERGRWTLAVCGRLSGPALSPPPESTTVWAALEATVDEAAGRFSAVATLVPPGALADRVDAASEAVEACAADAVRLCAVGTNIAPSGAGAQSAALIERVTTLVHTINEATASLVDLHLALVRTVDPVSPVGTLGEAWAELEA
jgi:hypothetical protein